MGSELQVAERVKCPICGEQFKDEKEGEKMPDKTPEKQAHFKGLVHYREEHPKEAFQGLLPVNEDGEVIPR